MFSASFQFTFIKAKYEENFEKNEHNFVKNGQIDQSTSYKNKVG